jgi:O-antigen/teichoic acid export membrane protein
MSLKSRFSWNTLVSFFSLAGVQMVKFLTSIVFVNVAGSFAVGIYFVFMSVYRLLNRGTTFGLGQAIIKRVSEQGSETGDTTADTVATAFTLRAVPLLLISTALAVFNSRVDSYVGLDLVWIFVIIALWGTALYSTFRSTLYAQRRIDVASGFDLFKDVGTAVIQVALIVVGYAQWGLVVGFITGLLVSAISISAFTRVPIHTASLNYERAKSLFAFAKFSYLDNLVGGEHRWLDIIILGFFVSSDQIGVYGIVYGLVQFGLLASTVLGRNILPEVSNLTSTDDTETSEQLLYRVLSYSTLFTFPILAGSFVIADRLLLDIYDLDTGALPLLVLAAGTVAYSVYNQLHQLIYGLDKPKYAFLLSSLSTSINAVIAVLLIPFIGILGAAISTSLSMLAALIGGMYVVIVYSDITVRLPLRPWGLQAASAVIMGVVVFAIKSHVEYQTRFYSAGLVLVGGVVYLSLVVSTDSFLRAQLRQVLARIVT